MPVFNTGDMIMTTAFIFPGQGSQTIGMGKEFYDSFGCAKDVFDQVDDALDFKLSDMIFSGEAEQLNLTENTQPALMAVSMAIMSVLTKEAGIDVASKVSFMAGHSLGEYSAYAAAGSFTLSDTARLLRIRGQAMQKAVPVGEGAMAAIIGLEMADVVSVCAVASTDDSICSLANDNCPGQIVISGHKAAVEKAASLATEKGARMAKMLPVSAPFHCALMLPAAEAMAQALSDVNVKMPICPIYANVTTKPIKSVDEIRALLVQQVTDQVRWRETIGVLTDDGATRFVEIGAGKVLTGLMRRIDKTAETLTVNAPADVDALVKVL